jgi:O-succinylbenzoic acid--CoA ligase
MAPFNLDLPRFIQASQPTVASMVPTMVYRLMRADPEELAALRFVLIGGARTPPDLRISAVDHGVTLLRSYGATETTSQIATSTAPDDPADPSVGFPLEGVSVRIVAGAGQTAIPGSVGRIEVDGPTVSPGYFAEQPRSGPFLTSDLGSMAADGRLTVHGRIDDMILSGGENVFLSTVTDAARSLGGVNDAVAVGVPDPEWGTAVVVVVDTTRRIDALDGEIRQVLRRREVPKRWVTVDSIPMLSNGKHDMAAIRDVAVSR